MNMNMNLNVNPKTGCNSCEMFTSQQNITTCQDMSHETYFHACRQNYFKNNLPHKTICYIQQFNPIQSTWVVAVQMRSVGLLQQSIPFLIAILYIIQSSHS